MKLEYERIGLKGVTSSNHQPLNEDRVRKLCCSKGQIRNTMRGTIRRHTTNKVPIMIPAHDQTDDLYKRHTVMPEHVKICVVVGLWPTPELERPQSDERPQDWFPDETFLVYRLTGNTNITISLHACFVLRSETLIVEDSSSFLWLTYHPPRLSTSFLVAVYENLESLSLSRWVFF